jgi:transposase
VPPTPRVIGIDDWAWRRGQRYGTLIVDLERNRPIDMLPDRDAQTVEAWLQSHPGVEIVARVPPAVSETPGYSLRGESRG